MYVVKEVVDTQGVKHKAYSYGELAVMNVLIENGITFESEKTFPDLRGDKGRLRFDFYVHGARRNFLIEVDGTQHRHQKRFTSKNLKRYDEMKNKYCEEKGIQLYRIIYCSGRTRDVRGYMKYVLKQEF